jgi:chaperonin GroES
VTPEDFENRDYDIRPIADPSAVTQMQQLARAEFLMRFKNDPTVNQSEINKRVFEAARIQDAQALLTVPPNPMMELAVKEKQAEVADKAASARLKEAQAGETEVKAKGLAYDQGVQQGGVGGVEGEPDNGMVPDPAQASRGGEESGIPGGGMEPGAPEPRFPGAPG